MQSWNRTSHFKSHLLLIWNFQMRLEMRSAIWNFWNFLKLELLIWNFQMRLEMRCAIWNFWNLKLFKPIMGSCLFETFRWDLKWDVLFETFETYHGELLIWNFQMRLEMRCAIWNFRTFSTFSNPSQKLLIWNFQMRLEMRCTIWNFETF